MKTTLALLMLTLAPLALHADNDVSRVNRSVRVEAGETVGDVSTVNGSVRIEDNVQAQNVETVNGAIEIGRNAVVKAVETVNGRVNVGAGGRAASVETVNGSLTLDERVDVSGPVTTVNGAVRLAPEVHVSGGVSNVNGRIELDRARVERGITTTNGDILVGAGSRVSGGILVEKPGFNWFHKRSRAPRVVIGPDAVVEGTMKFEREVELYVSDRAKVGAIEGATPIRFSGDDPDREERRDAQMQVEK